MTGFEEKASFSFVFCSHYRTFGLRSKVLTLGKNQIIWFFARLIVPLTYGRKYSRSEKSKLNLVFRSLNRTFATIEQENNATGTAEYPRAATHRHP